MVKNVIFSAKKIERTKESQKCSCGKDAVVFLTTDDGLKIYTCRKCFGELTDVVFEELQTMYYEGMKLKTN
jgi:predicted SprT family Zn-dependent metalloprotease